MAVCIKRSNLNTDNVNLIRQYLCLYPKTNSFNSFSNFTVKDPVLFYILDNDDLYLPYTFYLALTKKKPNIDRTYLSRSFNFKGNLFEHQVSVANEALDQLNQYGTTLLAVYPGFGKTVLASYLASKLNKITLVLYHRTVLEPQWLSTFNDMTDAKIWVIGNQTVIPDDFNVILCMDTQFAKIPVPVRQSIGCLIVDEAHAFCTPTHVSCLLGTQPLYVIACTATPEREDGMDSMIKAIIGNHSVSRISQKPFTVIRFLTGIKPVTRQNSQGTLDWSHLVKELCSNEIRNSYILGLVKNNSEFKILILTWSKSHAFQLHQWLNMIGESSAIMAGNRSTYSDSRVLVGTSSKIGTGFDEKSACPDFNGVRINMLILVGSTKSENLLEQLVGRVFRSDSPIVIDFVDDIPAVKRHWYNRKHWYVSRNAVIHDFKAPYATEKKELTQHNIASLAQSQLSSLVAS